MISTFFFLRFLGPLFFIVGCSILLHSKQYVRMWKDLEEFSLAYYLSAILALMLGLAMLVVHNVWNTTEEIAVSVIAWLTFLKGVLRLLIPQVHHAMLREFVSRYIAVAAMIAIVLGAWLTWMGYR